MFGATAPTPYDLRFRFLDIPVRVHPLFWVIGWLISHAGNDIRHALIFIACMFASILVHEYGHALSGRTFGSWPREIVLHSFGGYCAFEHDRMRPWQRIVMVLCGPCAGLLFAAIVFGVYIGAGVALGTISYSAHLVFTYLLAINIIWSLFNLIPIWPLDGGRISEELLTMANRRQGKRWGHIVSLLLAGVIALWFLQRTEYFNAILLGMIALQNFQMLQALHAQASYGGYAEDDADWWKR